MWREFYAIVFDASSSSENRYVTDALVTLKMDEVLFGMQCLHAVNFRASHSRRSASLLVEAQSIVSSFSTTFVSGPS